jgi:DNA invertase Pin-like site-specific DNA recombinase
MKRKRRSKPVIAYYRVSTEQQGRSGLGLEAQQAAVRDYAAQIGSSIAAEFTEVESGRRADRPELAKALAAAKRGKGRLVIAKLDRLARNVAFLSNLMESKVDFVACDNPHADRFTIHILAAVAEKEAKDISDRTKAALAAYKARGGKLGSARPGFWTKERNKRRLEGQKRAVEAARISKRKAAIEAYVDLLPLIRGLRTEGLSFGKIAERLNAEGHTTRQGKPFHAAQVRNIIDRSAR